MRAGPWVIAQTWTDLLFAHWRVPAESIRLPAPLELDTFEGAAYIGVVPFEISGHRPRFTPPLPRVSRFPELNVRTYAVRDGVPGVWFFSLDAASAVAVWSARRTYFLPYFQAEMAIAGTDEIAYASARPQAQFRARYAPDRPRLPVTARHARALADRALLALRPDPARPAAAGRHPARAVAAAARAGDDRGQHDVAGRPAGRAAAAALRAPPRRAHLAAAPHLTERRFTAPIRACQAARMFGKKKVPAQAKILADEGYGTAMNSGSVALQHQKYIIGAAAAARRDELLKGPINS